MTFADLVFLVIDQVVKPLTSLAVAVGFLYFLWGIAKYLLNSGDSKAQGEARGAMIYGVLGMFVMFSVWGLVYLLQYSFYLDGAVQPPIPRIYP